VGAVDACIDVNEEFDYLDDLDQEELVQLHQSLHSEWSERIQGEYLSMEVGSSQLLDSMLSDSSDAVYAPVSSRPSTPDSMLTDETEKVRVARLKKEAMELRLEIVRLTLMNDKMVAQKVLDGYKDFTQDGWCQLVNGKSNKPVGGYIQVSWNGANHVACLQEVVIWSKGEFVGIGQQCSHLCNRSTCKVRDHIVVESELKNQNRKGCVVWTDCLHGCTEKELRCTHDPPCIKYVQGYESQNDFLSKGLHPDYRQVR
jgi:hypothetical protein